METNNDELIPVTITRDAKGEVSVEIGHTKGGQHELWTESDIEAVSSTRQRIRKLLSDYFA